MSLSKEEILSAKDREPVLVKTPEWGGDVYLLPLSGDDRDRYDQYVTEAQSPGDDGQSDWAGCRSRLLAMMLCDGEGSLMGFSEAEVAALGRKAAGPIDRCFEEARGLCGLGADAIDNAKKNLDDDPSENSG